MSTAPTPHLSHAAPSVRGQLNGVLFVALFAAAVTSLSRLPAIAGLGLSPLIVGIVACQKGLNTSGGSMGVANAVNSSVVESILLLMITNVAISQMYLILFPKTGL